MAARRPKNLFTNLYRLAKVHEAAEEFLSTVFSPAKSAKDAPLGPTISGAWHKAQEAFNQKMTQHMYITGAAMAPTLNKAALQDPDALEKLVVRLLKRPSSRNVLVGDVVAFYSPLAQADAQHVMVRRVAAVEGQEMVSSSPDEEKAFRIPDGHVWVLADNEDLKANEVIDSRSFGHIPFGSVLGRVIYAVRSRHDHGPVPNNPESVVSDAPVVEAEVDIDEMVKGGQGEEDGSGSDAEEEDGRKGGSKKEGK